MSLTFAFNRRPWVFLPAVVLALGCTRLNPDYCDSTIRCSGGRVCEMRTNTCQAPGVVTDAAAEPDLPADVADARNSCAVDNDCKSADAGPTCVHGQCKKCGGANDCKAGTVCARDTGRCVECTATEGCQDTPASPVCVASKCAPCTQQPDACKVRYTDAPVCNTAGQCVGCVESVRDCLTATRPICGPGGSCVGCGDSAACAGRDPGQPVCDTSGACVECTSDKHCATAEKPICDPQSKKCVPCTTDLQCVGKQGSPNPGVCLLDQGGRCATDAETIYVQNIPGCKMQPTLGGGTAVMPYCYTQDGISSVTPAKRVIVLRGPDAVTPFTFNASPGDGPVTVVGQLKAAIAPGAFVGIRVNGGELHLRGLTISGSTQTGIVVQSGAVLHMNRCIVTGNKGGLLVDDAGFDIANSVFAGNKGAFVPMSAVTFGGVYLRAAAGKPAVFRNCTVVDNEVIGLACAEVTPVRSVLVTSNSVGDVLGCNATSSKVGGNPAFDPMRPYHLTAASPCVNAGDPMDFPADDLDGDARPLPAGGISDCGADELAP